MHCSEHRHTSTALIGQWLHAGGIVWCLAPPRGPYNSCGALGTRPRCMQCIKRERDCGHCCTFLLADTLGDVLRPVLLFESDVRCYEGKGCALPVGPPTASPPSPPLRIGPNPVRYPPPPPPQRQRASATAPPPHGRAPLDAPRGRRLTVPRERRGGGAQQARPRVGVAPDARPITDVGGRRGVVWTPCSAPHRPTATAAVVHCARPSSPPATMTAGVATASPSGWADRTPRTRAVGVVTARPRRAGGHPFDGDPQADAGRRRGRARTAAAGGEAVGAPTPRGAPTLTPSPPVVWPPPLARAAVRGPPAPPPPRRGRGRPPAPGRAARPPPRAPHPPRGGRGGAPAAGTRVLRRCRRLGGGRGGGRAADRGGAAARRVCKRRGAGCSGRRRAALCAWEAGGGGGSCTVLTLGNR